MDDRDDTLKALESRMAESHVFGQWQIGANRPENVRRGANDRLVIEPSPAGEPHLWRWETIKPFLDASLEALPESFTARRSLILNNPGLAKGTTQTLLVGIQTIGPGEIAWAHRHTVTAVRFAIEGGPDVFTVVDGEPLPMEPYDLILTPGWCWHDHHNRSDRPAVWLDALDVPLMLALNQNFYEELGESVQERRRPAPAGSPLLRPAWSAGRAAAPVRRYPWRETRPRLESLAQEPGSPHDGVVLEYADAATGGPTLTTLSCWVQWLPPGFEGEPHRHSASAAYFVIEGAGRTVIEDADFDWTRHDSLVVPNWIWHRHENRSRTNPAILFCVNDIPLLSALGLYREEPGDSLGIAGTPGRGR